jgi:hypothetical protein
VDLESDFDRDLDRRGAVDRRDRERKSERDRDRDRDPVLLFCEPDDG